MNTFPVGIEASIKKDWRERKTEKDTKESIDDTTESHQNDNPLAKYIHDSFEELLAFRAGPIRVYKHKPSGLPIAVVVGGYNGTVFGGIVYFREPTDSMNMEIETSMEMMTSMLDFIQNSMIPSTKPSDNIDGLWERFKENLFACLSLKNGFTKDGKSTPVIPVAMENRENTPSQNNKISSPKTKEPKKRKRESSPKKDEVLTECMICYENPPDTTVLPCLHNVVCAECSIQLKNNNRDKNTCCQCRCPITGIFYPDNTMDKIIK